MTRKTHRRNGGWLIAELGVTLILLGTIGVCLARLMQTTNHFHAYHLLKHRCLAAAEAQLDSYSATGEPLDEEIAKRLWPAVELETETRAGEGPWQGLTRITVTAKGWYGGREREIVLQRCVASVEEAP
jgi:hypothetical protein